MKSKTTQKLLSGLMALVMMLSCLVTPALASPAEAEGSVQLTGSITDASAAGEKITIMVQLAGDTTFMQTGDLTLASADHDGHMAELARAESRIERTPGNRH